MGRDLDRGVARKPSHRDFLTPRKPASRPGSPNPRKPSRSKQSRHDGFARSYNGFPKTAKPPRVLPRMFWENPGNFDKIR